MKDSVSLKDLILKELKYNKEIRNMLYNLENNEFDAMDKFLYKQGIKWDGIGNEIEFSRGFYESCLKDEIQRILEKTLNEKIRYKEVLDAFYLARDDFFNSLKKESEGVAEKIFQAPEKAIEEIDKSEKLQKEEKEQFSEAIISGNINRVIPFLVKLEAKDNEILERLKRIENDKNEVVDSIYIGTGTIPTPGIPGGGVSVGANIKLKPLLRKPMDFLKNLIGRFKKHGNRKVKK